MVKVIRKQKRHHLVYYLKVVDPQTGEPIGRLVDISPIGIMLVSENPLEVGQHVAVRLNLPEGGNWPEQLDLTCETVWRHRDVNPEYYAHGLKFLEPAREIEFVIKDLIDEFGFWN